HVGRSSQVQQLSAPPLLRETTSPRPNRPCPRVPSRSASRTGGRGRPRRLRIALTRKAGVVPTPDHKSETSKMRRSDGSSRLEPRLGIRCTSDSLGSGERSVVRSREDQRVHRIWATVCDSPKAILVVIESATRSHLRASKLFCLRPDSTNR